MQKQLPTQSNRHLEQSAWTCGKSQYYSCFFSEQAVYIFFTSHDIVYDYRAKQIFTDTGSISEMLASNEDLDQEAWGPSPRSGHCKDRGLDH